MRKLFNLFAAALVVLAAVSCEKNEVLPDSTEGKVVTLSAAIDNGETKTSLGNQKIDDMYPILWSVNDKIAVINNGKLFEFTLSSGADTKTGKFTCADADGFDASKPIKAFYPAAGVTLENGTVKYNVPSKQIYANGTYSSTFCNGAVPMAAYTENSANALTFYQLFGIVKLQLKGDGTEKLKSIEFVSDKAVSGAATVAFSNAQNSITLNDATVDGKKVLFQCNSNLILSNEEVTEILIAVPDGYHKFSVSIVTDKGIYYKEVSAEKLINPFVISKMSVLDLPTFANKASYVENGVYLGEGVALPGPNSTTITWAPVNCGYDAQNTSGLLYGIATNPCPMGWRMPSKAEVESLLGDAGGKSQIYFLGETPAGVKAFGKIDAITNDSKSIVLPANVANSNFRTGYWTGSTQGNTQWFLLFNILLNSNNSTWWWNPNLNQAYFNVNNANYANYVRCVKQ